jgi:exodeoxyribonuclease-3
MNIISYNVNGIRSAISKGFVEWLSVEQPDIIGLQEIKALEADIDKSIFTNLGYHVYWFPAVKKGYSGVAVLSKVEAKQVHYGNAYEQSDFEGRVIRLDFENFTFINAYFPSGTSGDIRQVYKYQWLNEFYDYCNALQVIQPNLIICGDYNICHKPIDIHDPISNKKSSGFLPEERAWMDKWFSSNKIDTLRHFNNAPDLYSWWSYRAASRERNKGWRIDYITVSENLKQHISGASILSAVKHSDHCPVQLFANL